MLSNSITVNHDGTAYTMSRVKESNYQSEFFYRSATLDLILQIGHTIPNSTGIGESHVVTLWAMTYDVDGVLVSKERAISRIVTEGAKQDTASIVAVERALADFMGTNGTDIANRGS